jgi:hypothetical protein
MLGHVAHVGIIINAYKNLLGKPDGIHSRDLDVDGKIILEWISRKQEADVWTGCIWFRIGISGGLL